METRSWPAPERLLGQVIAVHAGKRLDRRPGDCIEGELRDRLNVRPAILDPACDVMQATN